MAGSCRATPGQTDEVFRLRAIGHSLQQAFERYYIAISVLVKNGPGVLGTAELESLCQQAAQRLSLLYAPAAPEFFDKTLFRSFIQKLRELKLVWPDENSKLVFDERLDAWAKDAKVILGRELRHTIERVSPEAAEAGSGNDESGLSQWASLKVRRIHANGASAAAGSRTRCCNGESHSRRCAASSSTSSMRSTASPLGRIAGGRYSRKP